jgi:hypothetical protein
LRSIQLGHAIEVPESGRRVTPKTTGAAVAGD